MDPNPPTDRSPPVKRQRTAANSPPPDDSLTKDLKAVALAPPLPDVVIFAADFSGSTSGQRDYWSRVGQCFDGYLAEYGADKVIALRWDSSLQPGTHTDLKDNVASNWGRGGTSPQVVARYLVDKHGVEFNVTKLCLLTDGEIGSWDVQECDRILAAAPRRIPDVEACLFGPYNPDLSVVAPFARAAKFTIRKNDAILAQGDATVAVESSGILDSISTPEDFFARFPSLKQVIVVQNLGRTNTELRDRLLELQKRLIDWIAWDNRRKAAETMQVDAAAAAAAATDQDDATQHPILRALNKGDYDGAVAATRTLIHAIMDPSAGDDDDADKDEDVGKKVSRLIGQLVEGCTAATFRTEALHTRRGQRAVLAATPQDGVMPADVAADDDPSMPTQFECPIMLDDASAPVLLVTQGDGTSILDGMDQNVIDDVTNCPLNVLRHRELVTRVAARLDHVIGIDAFRGLYADAAQAGMGNVDMLSPYTREPILGCIPLGIHRQHAHLAGFIVRQFTTRGTVLGNPHLWVAAVYLVILHHVPRLADNASFMTAFRSHLKYRFNRYETNLALSGMSGYPIVKAPLGVALWYCLCGSTEVFAGDTLMFRQERLRQFWGIARYLHDLVGGVLEWPTGQAWDTRARVLRVFTAMMARKTQLPELLTDVRRLYQGSVVVPPIPIEWTRVPSGLGVMEGDKDELKSQAMVVFVDGPADEGMVKASPVGWMCKVLPIPVLLALAAKVDPQKKSGDIVLAPGDFTDAPEPEVKHNYGYPHGGTADFDDSIGPTPICPATLRPFLADPRDRVVWTDRAVQSFQCPISEQLHAYNLFVEYVRSKHAYPRTIAELVGYYSMREKGRLEKPRDTLPRDVAKTAEKVVAAYVRAFALREGGVPEAKEFRHIVNCGRNKEERKRREEEWIASVGGLDAVREMWS